MPALLISVHKDTQFCFPEPVYPRTSGLAPTLSQDRAEVHTGVRCKHSQIFRTGTWWSLAWGTATQGSVLAFSLPPSPQEPVKHSYEVGKTRWLLPFLKGRASHGDDGQYLTAKENLDFTSHVEQIWWRDHKHISTDSAIPHSPFFFTVKNALKAFFFFCSFDLSKW